ncbi:MAG: DCC1-like thiol-disulfide oxidoreductase family protein [Arenimonas sp.]
MKQLANGVDDVWLVYDGECPICNAYCKYARINDAVGRLHLIDARQPGPLMDEITAAGLDIDQGMVVKFKDVTYYGPEAIRMLTLLSTRSGFFNRMNYYFFGTEKRAGIFYPFGKALRNLVLKLMGIRYIENLKNNNQPSIAE